MQQMADGSKSARHTSPAAGDSEEFAGEGGGTQFFDCRSHCSCYWKGERERRKRKEKYLGFSED
jgi:hypothetical protein